ncbi:putative diphthamide synthesis protein-domain-containing protein [Melampsora americana]|nr:putative diphthamide synthesis protein-domain-containing protein [Melampsora americana]
MTNPLPSIKKDEPNHNDQTSSSTPEKPTRRRFVGKAGPAQNHSTNLKPIGSRPHQIPNSILEDKILNSAISELLPKNYNFEVLKTISQVIRHKIYFENSVRIAEDVVVLGDVTYGACCVDDYTAKSLGCEMLKLASTRSHLLDTVRANFPIHLPSASSLDVPSREMESSASTRQGTLVGTVQFVAAVQGLKTDLEQLSPLPGFSERLKITEGPDSDEILRRKVLSSTQTPIEFRVTVPQVKPLSPGEILGCTAPKLNSDVDAILYVGDGRFHLESIMIANPTIPAYRYDPYEKRITEEGYDHQQMRQIRGKSIRKAIASLKELEDEAKGSISDDSKNWAIVIGTLGRQGSLSVVNSLSTGLRARTGNPNQVPVPILISELSPQKLSLFKDDIGIFVQTSCPRLSIDWGESFDIPLLSPYEAKVSLGEAKGFTGMGEDGVGLLENYPMDFYADDSLGDWTPRHGRGIKSTRRPKAG